jgi:hypothetical protein
MKSARKKPTAALLNQQEIFLPPANSPDFNCANPPASDLWLSGERALRRQ